MSNNVKLSEQEQINTVFSAIAFVVLVFSLGPVVLLMALLWLGLFYIIQAELLYALFAAAISVLAGMVMYASLTEWILSPIHMTLAFYGEQFPDNAFNLFFHDGEMNRFVSAIGIQYEQWLSTPMLWAYHLPAGQFFGAIGYALLFYFFKSPLGQLKREKEKEQKFGKVSNLCVKIINQRPAETSEGTLIGTDRYAGTIELTDKCANQHTLVLGTTGSGKTVTVCNIVESAINRGLPLIYIDGKGDYDLASRVVRFGKEQGRPVSLFSMKGESIAYNPLSCGGFTSKKDRIVELREWSEEHYKKLAEGYLQCIFKVMEACHIPCNLSTLSSHLDLKKLKSLLREQAEHIPNVRDLMIELDNQEEAAKNIESLASEIRNFTASEIGPLFQEKEGKPILTLEKILEQNGVAYFCLPALEFPSMSQTLGRLIINDLKATMAQQLAKNKRNKLYAIFDEFSVFAGEQVLNVINMGRSAGIHAVLSTQSLSDIASGRKENTDHFINQVVGNCNNFILHRQNSAEDAEKLAAMMGTKSTLEYTAQISQITSTHMGTVRRTRGFIAHPDDIKTLKTGEAFFFSKENNKVRKMKARKSWI